MARADDGRAAARPYRSPRRAAQAGRTRAKVLVAATERFVADGYAATTMRSVAEAAGVSLPTVELIFGTKAQLLKAAIDVAIAGDDESVPMLDREWAKSAQQAADSSTYVAHFARALRAAHTRSAALIVVAYEAARTDDTIAALTRRLSRQRAVTVAWVVDGLRKRTSLRPELTRAMAIDIIWWLMDPITFDRLTRERRWTPNGFERWFAESVVRLVLPVNDERQVTTAR